ncbi:MAG TPA: hypothetical protein VNW47_13380 [Terriglobales bacterium]|nr:hypothetical protein [Terriglobales bacterium]
MTLVDSKGDDLLREYLRHVYVFGKGTHEHNVTCLSSGFGCTPREIGGHPSDHQTRNAGETTPVV